MKSALCGRIEQIVEAESRYSDLPDDLARHLDECPDCRRHFDATRVELDPSVFERLAADRRRALVAARAEARAAAGYRWRRLGVAAASLAAAATILLVLVDRADRGGDSESVVATALVEDHIRYLADEDRRSTVETFAVSTLLQPYVDFPLQIPEIAESRLTGSRRCYLLGRRTALLFYEGRAGPLSYFVMESDDLEPPGRPCGSGSGLICCSLKGYRLVSWERAGLLHALVGPDSDRVEAAAGSARDAFAHESQPDTKGNAQP